MAHRGVEAAYAARYERNGLTYFAKYRSLLDLTPREMRHLKHWADRRGHRELLHELACDCGEAWLACPHHPVPGPGVDGHALFNALMKR